MDVTPGIAVILVGTGTLLTIRVDITAVFKVSNRLSGYIGNSLVVLFASANLFWL